MQENILDLILIKYSYATHFIQIISIVATFIEIKGKKSFLLEFNTNE